MQRFLGAEVDMVRHRESLLANTCAKSIVAQNLRHEGRRSSGKQKKQKKIATLALHTLEGEVSLGRGEHAPWEMVHGSCIFWEDTEPARFAFDINFFFCFSNIKDY